ncbi:MAG: tyrosine-type recombinase/integrase [Acidimicrobiales bacterium]
MNVPSQVRFVGPLAPYMAGYQEELEAKGYKPSSVAHHLQLVAKVSRWLESQGLGVAGLTPDRVETFFDLRRQHVGFLHTSAHALSGFVLHLERQGALDPSEPGEPTAVDRVLDNYRRHLLSEQGFVEAAARRYVHIAREFLSGCVAEGQLHLDAVKAETVIRFLRVACATRKPSTAKSVAVSLRSLLRFLYLEGLIDQSLAKVVPTPGGPSSSGLPKYLSVEEVAKLLASCNRRTVAGRRDYAILLLLGRLGLRAGEVAGLGLEDVDWRVGQIRVRGKGGRVDVLPLPADVGKALDAYVRGGRPRQSGGALFRSVLAPHGGLSGSTVTGIVYRACERAGLDHAGAHRLRHTAATQMLRGGASLNEIAQVLRHVHIQSTAIYAKVDRVRMVELARSWPGSES